jgi:hypothetical protein
LLDGMTIGRGEMRNQCGSGLARESGVSADINID